MGTAYLTPIVPLFEDGQINAIFAVWPWTVCAGLVTPYIGASTSRTLGDTCLYPADKSGRLLSQRLIGCWNTPIHRTALRNAGYELELVVPRG